MPDKGPDTAASLRARRSELVEQFESIDSAVQLFEFQERVATEIKEVEPAAFRDRSSPQREHLKILRLMGDSVAWTRIDPHSIRQFGKHPGKSPAIGSQGSAFDFVLKCARLAADSGWSVLICDLTNVLKVCDLVIWRSGRKIMLIECGPDTPARFEGRGRKERQKARVEAVIQVLSEGKGHIPGTPGPFSVYDSPVEAKYSWTVVERAARMALADGAGLAGGDGDVVWAIRSDAIESDGLPLKDEALCLTSEFKDPLVVLSSEALEHPSSLIPPPLAWPLPLELRQALLERDVRLLHVIDLAEFLEIEYEGTRIISTRRDKHGELLEPFFTIRRSDGLVAFASTRFLEEVLHGFLTIESGARLLLSGLDHIDDDNVGTEITEARTGPYGPFIDELLTLESELGSHPPEGEPRQESNDG